MGTRTEASRSSLRSGGNAIPIVRQVATVVGSDGDKRATVPEPEGNSVSELVPVCTGRRE